MDSPDIKEQMLQIKIKVRSIGFFYAFYNHLTKSAKSAGPSPMYSPESNNKYYKEKAKSEDGDSLRILLISVRKARRLSHLEPMYSPCIIEEI